MISTHYYLTGLYIFFSYTSSYFISKALFFSGFIHMLRHTLIILFFLFTILLEYLVFFLFPSFIFYGFIFIPCLILFASFIFYGFTGAYLVLSYFQALFFMGLFLYLVLFYLQALFFTILLVPTSSYLISNFCFLLLFFLTPRLNFSRQSPSRDTTANWNGS